MNPLYQKKENNNTLYGKTSAPFVSKSATSVNGLTTSEGGRLGIFTKSQAKLKQPLDLSRVHEFLLQDQSCDVLRENKIVHRVCNCLKKRIDKNKNRKVMLNEERMKAHYTNVQRCGSVWACPVCAKQITEIRREEIKTAVENFRKINCEKGADIKLLTLTFSHHIGMPLSGLLASLKKAVAKFYAHRTFKEFTARCSIVGKVRSFEVTYGENGWHPHFHILLLSHDVDDLAFKHTQSLSKLWIKCCVDSGLNAPSSKHGLDVRDGEYAEEYVAKWGIDYEMTKGHTKKGKEGGFTPFDLLQLSFENNPTYGGRTPSSLFAEYVVSTKGFRQLVWQRGLKALLLIEELTDEEIAEQTEKLGIEVYDLPDVIFYLLKKYKRRHDFLTCIENDWQDGVYGSGTTENLIFDLAQLEINAFNSEYDTEDAQRLSEFMEKLKEIYN